MKGLEKKEQKDLHKTNNIELENVFQFHNNFMAIKKWEYRSNKSAQKKAKYKSGK